MDIGNDSGRQPDNGRAQLAAEAVEIARQVAVVLDQNPPGGKGPYPLADVLRQLAEQHAALRTAVLAYPLSLAVDADGRPDKLGAELAGLMGYLQHVLVLYHGLADVPDQMRAQANRDLSATHLRARRFRDRVPRR